MSHRDYDSNHGSRELDTHSYDQDSEQPQIHEHEREFDDSDSSEPDEFGSIGDDNM